MEPIQKIMVLLDMSAMDETLLKYASFISDSSYAQKIYFVNIIKNITLPDEVKKEFPDLEKKALEERKSLIKNKIDEFYRPEREMEIKYHIRMGPPLRTILEFAQKQSIDLIILGRKKTIPGTGVLAQRLARRANCNLSIIPEGKEPKIEKLLVPIDFSYHSQMALEQAIFVSNQNNQEVEIICQNVFNVPVGYHYSGKTYEEFAEVMKKNAKANFEKFIRNIDTKGIKIIPEYSLDTNENLASDILDLAAKLEVDGILIGAKGRTAAAALFLGSLSEKLINSKLDVPLMIVRPKGKNVGLFETLREI
jgi:nucleotide-binding universal stress UspA family protein